MNTHIIELKKRYTEDLIRSGNEFLDVGIDLFYRHLNSESDCIQSALSTVASGVEFMLKAFIADKNLGLIFRNIPAGIRTFLSCPESIPHFFEWRRYEPDIRSDKYETLDLQECISCFYIFFPHMKQLLLPHTKFLCRWGNASGHDALPQIESFDFMRTGFAVLQILSLLGEKKSSRLIYYSLTDCDRKFIETFGEQRIERVNLAIEHAKRKAVESTDIMADVVVARDWETFAAQCPVCKYNGRLNGYTEIAVGEDEEGPKSSLDFFATTFECDVCGLCLYDIEEIKLASMGILYDRSEDLDRWFREHREFTDWMTG